MSKGKQNLDELLREPIIRLLMARDRVRPEEVRMLLERALRPAQRMVPPHVIEQARRQVSVRQ